MTVLYPSRTDLLANSNPDSPHEGISPDTCSVHISPSGSEIISLHFYLDIIRNFGKSTQIRQFLNKFLILLITPKPKTLVLFCSVMLIFLTIGCAANPPRKSVKPLPVPPVTVPQPKTPTESNKTSLKDNIHVVSQGETLSSISRQTTGNIHNWRLLANYNKITPPYEITVGQKIKIPQKLAISPKSRSGINVIIPGNRVNRTQGEIPAPAPAPLPPTKNTKPNKVTDDETPAPLPPTQNPKPNKVTNETPTPAPLRPAQNTKSDRATAEDTTYTEGQEKPAEWLIIRGSYFPKEVKIAPDLVSGTLTLVSPGAQLQYIGQENGWYKVITPKGEGYLKEEDAKARE